MNGLREYQTEEFNVWTPNRMRTWVQNISQQSGWREDYSQGFIDHEIDGKCMTELTSGLLKEMGVVKIGHRLTILRELRKLSEPTSNPAPAVMPTQTSNQGYTVHQPAYQLPIYMPQQNNYNATCFPSTIQQENQLQPFSQPSTNGRSYQPIPAESVQVPYQEQKSSQVMIQRSEESPLGRDQPAEQQVTEQNEVNAQFVEQQHMYEEDDFPNAQNLETPPSDNIIVHQNADNIIVHQNDNPAQNQVAEEQQQPCLEEEQSASTEKSIGVQQMRSIEVQQNPVMPSQHISKEKITEPVTADLVQPRPSAWGSNNKLRIAPHSTATPSKLFVQTNRLNRFSSKTPQQDKRSRPSEVKADEQYKPTPQAGDILKGTVKRVVTSLGAFVDINGPGDALLTNKEGVTSFRVDVNKSYWVMVKKVEDINSGSKGRRIHLTSFVPGVMVQGTISHAHPISGARQVGFFVNIGWWKPGLLLHKRMRDKNKKKHQPLSNLFVLSHKLKVVRNQQSTAELDLTEIEPQNWKPEDVFCWLESFYGPGERLPENIPQLHGKDIFSLTPQVLDQLGITDAHKQEKILLCVKMMTEQRTYLTQRTKKQSASSSTNQAQKRSEIPSPPTGDSHFPALGNKAKRR